MTEYLINPTVMQVVKVYLIGVISIFGVLLCLMRFDSNRLLVKDAVASLLLASTWPAIVIGFGLAAAMELLTRFADCFWNWLEG
jgi:hypothetical protein